MITRKIAKQVLDKIFEDEIAQFHRKHLELLLDKFTDELTPDEMLAEMRDWAKERGYYINIHESYNSSDLVIHSCLTDIRITKANLNKERFSGVEIIDLICVEKHTREEAITEAYRQFKEAK